MSYPAICTIALNLSELKLLLSILEEFKSIMKSDLLFLPKVLYLSLEIDLMNSEPKNPELPVTKYIYLSLFDSIGFLTGQLILIFLSNHLYVNCLS